MTARPDRSAYLAATWALLFAVPSGYWALGGPVGLGLVSDEAERLAVERADWFVLLLWATAAGKVLAGLLALSLVRAWGRRLPRRLRLLATGGLGVVLLLYGVTSLARSVPALVGAVPRDASIDPTVLRWYVFAWQPFWVLGGLAFLLAAVRFHRQKRDLDPYTDRYRLSWQPRYVLRRRRDPGGPAPSTTERTSR